MPDISTMLNLLTLAIVVAMTLFVLRWSRQMRAEIEALRREAIGPVEIAPEEQEAVFEMWRAI